jgi:aminoglycoside 3-N-acetyltransferase I
MSDSTRPLAPAYEVLRLGPSDRHVARRLFEVMAGVFEEGHDELSDAYIDGLLARAEFWAIAARSGDDVIGGLTAHTLPMTRTESREIFIYDIAVRRDHQRRGVGRALMTHLGQAAADAGIREIFVPAEAEDLEAIEFYRGIGGAEIPVAFFTFSR